MEKEETLAASSRSRSTFVSKVIKTEIGKRGVGKAEGETGVRSHTQRRQSRHVQQGKHLDGKSVHADLSFKVFLLKELKTITQKCLALPFLLSII